MSVELWHDLLEAERTLRRAAEEMARRWREAFFAVAAAAAAAEYEERLRAGTLPSSPEEAAPTDLRPASGLALTVAHGPRRRGAGAPAPRGPSAPGGAGARPGRPPEPPPAPGPSPMADDRLRLPDAGAGAGGRQRVEGGETHPAPPPDAGRLLEALRGRDAPSFFQKDFFEKDGLLIGLIGAFGFSGRPRLAKALAAALGISPKSGSISRAFDRCVRLGLLMPHRDPAAPFSLFSLSPRGKEAYRAVFGREPVPSEAELLLSAHPGAVAHAAFCVWARELAEAAGYQAAIPGRPAAPGPQPDLILRAGGLVLPVEVERALSHDPDKWRAIAAARGRIAVVAVDPEAAERLLSVIEGIGAPYALTDFSYLVERQPRDPRAFWRIVRGIPELGDGS